MSEWLGGRSARSSSAILRQVDPPAGARAGAVQIASAGFGAALALSTGCAALGTASLGALLDARRFAWRRGYRAWLFAAAAALLVLGVTQVSIEANHADAVPWMIVFGVVGLAVNGLSVFAVFPFRIREFGAACGRASSWAYLVLIAAGAIGAMTSIDVPLMLVVALLSMILVFGLMLDARERL